MMEIITQALAEQQQIGWLNVFCGFMTKSFLILADTHMENKAAPPQPQEGQRRK
jgi:hypothetical protein